MAAKAWSVFRMSRASALSLPFRPLIALILFLLASKGAQALDEMADQFVEINFRKGRAAEFLR